ncbi:ATP-dependent DNA helicase yku80 [Yamadazyma tenuis]|uniref:DNA helicase n=1 Tax=Candida tenuis (strain ATCC 10573 / BCRC 21748 / CBS 615 / JCM 9827 / NBRC 10315 / NRRL Y-1498 / VKM Y-70) TaxID=590646 RepID=G3B8I8_CANTC|nr:SPOC domain-like protein [Yamadazyma tenuis ATCC 10573]XP_006687913.1 uncharacterized protein CANTEDRAFT_109737 [Yamadazyma tenuis ATCC 10573]EGV61742.1 SPOC domain-like protein [Yamadazyma tenuis ATCC 10573]EGV61743.1 hypothetical protein CANTEDRAFT_109737 [Yamadazyma tenuis ATCC 10573]WEJ92971.1 ATP-dependent DNA helicase yku80 [Yamadazyma tenuis]
MSKELTTFVVDLDREMARELSPGQSHLDFGLKYMYHLLMAKIFNTRVTDFVSVIACHAPTSNVDFSEDDQLKGIYKVLGKTSPGIRHLKEVEWFLVPNTASSPDDGDVIHALSVAVALMNQDAKGAFIRNIVVITNGEGDVRSFGTELADSTVAAVNNMGINVSVVGVNFGSDTSPTQVKNVQSWRKLVAQYNNGHVLDANDVAESITKNPPLKRVDPRVAFKGSLRLGTDPAHLGSSGKDTSQISLDVEIYPAVMPEKLPAGHNYLVKDGEVKHLTTEYGYYVELDNKDHENNPKKKVPLEKGNWTDGYKYTNNDIIALDSKTLAASRLAGEPAIDVVGFMKIDDLPVAFFTEESKYLVPAKLSTNRNLLGYNCLCEALLDSRMLVIGRFVQKENDEVKICALIPSITKISTKIVYSLQSVRLACKEDEKSGRFPQLSTEEANSEDLKLMEKFILSRDLDAHTPAQEANIDQYCINNGKVTLLSHQTLEERIRQSKEAVSTDLKLMSNNPAIHKFHTNLFKMLREAVDKTEVEESPVFLTNNTIPDIPTNLFNLSNILLNGYNSFHSSWLSQLNKTDGTVEKLAKKTIPFRPKTKRRKLDQEKVGAGTYGENEGEYEFIDIEDILT